MQTCLASKKSFLFGHLFFNIQKRFLRQKTGGACLYMPRDGHWLGSFEVIPPKMGFRGQKKANSPALKTAVSDPKLWCFLFFRRKFCHAFLDSRKNQGLLPDSTTPDRLRQRRQTESADFLSFWVLASSKQKTKVFQNVPHLDLIYTPKAAHSLIFVTGGSVFARQMLAKKSRVLARQACTSWPPQEQYFSLARICHAVTDPPVT